MTKYRSRLDIIYDILSASMKGINKTRLTYKAYISFPQMMEYINFLEKRGLLLFDESANLFHVTEKGLQYLNIYEKVKQIFPLEPEPDKGLPLRQDAVGKNTFTY